MIFIRLSLQKKLFKALSILLVLIILFGICDYYGAINQTMNDIFCVGVKLSDNRFD